MYFKSVLINPNKLYTDIMWRILIYGVAFNFDFRT